MSIMSFQDDSFPSGTMDAMVRIDINIPITTPMIDSVLGVPRRDFVFASAIILKTTPASASIGTEDSARPVISSPLIDSCGGCIIGCGGCTVGWGVISGI